MKKKQKQSNPQLKTKTVESRKPLTTGKRFLMMLFPPYGIYYLLFKSRFKWFIKIPISFILILFLIVAIDQAVNPFRVENVLVEEEISAYLMEHSEEKMGTLKYADRKGAFLWDENTHLVYRTLTSKGLFDFVMTPKSEGEYKVSGVFQSYPTIAWRSEEDKERYPTAPSAMLYFYKHKEELGDLKTATEDENVNIIQTTKGTFRYTFEKNKVVSVEKETGEIVLDQKNEYDMPEGAIEYFSKNENELGKLTEVYGYDIEPEKEMYFVKTNQGLYRVDIYTNGSIKLLQQDGIDEDKETNNVKNQDINEQEKNE
jgi:hypothetical protein